MLVSIYLLLAGADLGLVLVAIVTRDPIVRTACGALALPLSLVNAFSTGALEFVSQEFSSGAWHTTDYVYTNALALWPFWMGLFFFALALSLYGGLEVSVVRRQQREEREMAIR